jgi:hypothetical protein
MRRVAIGAEPRSIYYNFLVPACFFGRGGNVGRVC